MSGEFFQTLMDCLEREGRRTSRPRIDPDVWREFCADAPRSAAVPPPPADGAARRKAPPPVPDDVPIPSGSLEELARFVAACRRCPLAPTRRNVVFGEGNPAAKLMFIGEGPGADEDRLGRPFVGRAGQLLDKMIAAMQFRREEVYIANVVKCRPPGNRVPTPDEAACCIGYLRRQIELLHPEVIVLLGATAVTFLMGPLGGITKIRGKWLSYEGIPVMPTFHPAYLLRQESAKREAWLDLQAVMKVFGKTPPSRRRG